LHWLPISHALSSTLSPGLSEIIEMNVAGTSAERWSQISVMPGASAVEAARILALTLFFVAASQLPWRTSAAAAMIAGTLVSLVGFAHLVSGSDAIFGFYSPVDGGGSGGGLLTTFVNPNHQSSLLLLGIFCAIAIAVEEHRRSHESHDARRADRHGEHTWAAIGCAILQLMVLLLSLSRGALIVFALLSVPCLWIVLRSRTGQGLRPVAKRRAILVAVASLLISIAISRQGAWQQLATINEQAYVAKFDSVRDAINLISLSPIVGTGRGTFVDLFPLVDRYAEVTGYTVTHIESFYVAVIVEWGPIVGGCAVAGAILWWVLAIRSNKHSARRLALLGVLAVGLHNLGDFNLEFLGVAAPLAAVSGGLSATRVRACRVRRLASVAIPVLLLFGVLAWLNLPGTWPNLRDQSDALASETIGEEEALSRRPLDARVHGVLARRHAERGEWGPARDRAIAMTRLLPNLAEGWLLLSAAESALGNRGESRRAMRRALQRVRRQPSAALADYFRERYPADEFAGLILPTDESWPIVLGGLERHAPAYADEVVRELEVDYPHEPSLLRFRGSWALEHGHPDLALHYARLYCEVAPHQAQAWVLQARALRGSVKGARERQVQTVLEEALRESLDDPGLVEEHLILSYIADGEDRALSEAEALLPVLLQRPASGKVKKRRRTLGRRIAERRRGVSP
jgi:hypothetical protein